MTAKIAVARVPRSKGATKTPDPLTKRGIRFNVLARPPRPPTLCNFWIIMFVNFCNPRDRNKKTSLDLRRFAQYDPNPSQRGSRKTGKVGYR